MEIVNDYPPNWNLIETAFPKAKEWKAFFAYDGKIFNPFKSEIRSDNKIHEKTHFLQQGNNPDEWWFRYISDPSFRTQMEIEAYGAQVAFVKQKIGTGIVYECLLDECAQFLSSELYGNLLSFGQARSKIRNYTKGLEQSLPS